MKQTQTVLYSLVLMMGFGLLFHSTKLNAQESLYSIDFASSADIADWSNTTQVSFGTDVTIGNYMIADGNASATAPRSASFTTNDFVCVEFDMMLPTNKADGTTANTIGGGNTGGFALMKGTNVAAVIGFRGSGSGAPDHILSTGGTGSDYLNVTAGTKASATRDMWLHYTLLLNTKTQKGDLYITNPVDGKVYSHPARLDQYIKNISSLTHVGIVSNAGYAIGVANLRVNNPQVSHLTLTAQDDVRIQYIPSAGYQSTVQYNTTAQYTVSYNKAGRVVASNTRIDLHYAEIEYSVEDSQGTVLKEAPIRIDGTGLLTILPEATPGEYTIKAKSGNVVKTLSLSLQAPGKADKLEIVGDEIITVPDNTASFTYQGIATVMGNILPDKTVSWSIEDDKLNCTIDEVNGVLTIPSDCPGGTLMLQASIVSDELSAVYPVRIRTREQVEASIYNIKGVILKNGLISLADAAGLSEMIIQKLDNTSSQDKLVLKAYGKDGRVIAEKTADLGNTLVEGIQSWALDADFLFKGASYLKAYVLDENGQVISQDIEPITAGRYKQLPLVGDWITNPEMGNGPTVMNPTQVPAGIDPSLVNTKTQLPTYRYDSEYPKITTDNLLWYKTGAYNAGSTIYDRDGSDWEQQALPIGNGYLGGMLFGMPGKDHIQFNEETFWAAGYRGTQTKVAETYINPNMSEGINGFMNTGNLFVDFGLPQSAIINNYYRDLNIEEATAHVQFKYNNVTYKREYFASYPAQAMVFRYTSDTPGQLNFSVNPVSAHPGRVIVKDGEIRIIGKLKDSEPYSSGGNAAYNQESDLEYCLIVKVIAEDGSLVDEYAQVNVVNASSVTIIMTAATDYDPNQFLIGSDGKVDPASKPFKSTQGVQYAIDKAADRIALVEGKSYKQIKAEHIADYRKLFSRVSFSLTDPNEVCQLPTNELQVSYKNVISGISAGQKVSFNASSYKALDKHLEELHYNYARYLMIASSRETSLPSTLQGKWNQSVAEIWGSCYCININLEMNYWFVGGANLHESGTALIHWLNSQIPAGRITAKNAYGIEPKQYTLGQNAISFSPVSDKEGDDLFIMHTKQAINGTTDKTGSGSIQSPGNMAFLMYNVWDLYKTSGDKQMLARQVYPILRKAANFYTQYMYKNKRSTTNKQLYPKGYYYTTGSGRSPEHGPVQEGIKYDLQLVAGLFDYVLEAAEVLQLDADKQAVWKEIRENLEVPVALGTDKQIKEWDQERAYNKDASGASLGDPTHRHMSHLVALYPGNLINRETPDFFEGAKVVLNNRGDESTGWSIANKFLMWARVLDGDKALQLFRYQLAQRTYQNLFDYHAPFQIDGNFGSAAGVMELLMQSQTGTIYLLPALPSVWDKGSIRGIKAKTGAEVSIDWAAGKATSVSILPAVDGDITIGYDKAESMTVSDGQSTQTILPVNGLFLIPQARAGVELSISWDNPVSLPSLSENAHSAFRVYPNPTKGIVHIEYPESEGKDYRLVVHDSNGVRKGIYTLLPGREMIDLSEMGSSGIYFLSIYDDTRQVASQKVLLTE